MFVWEDALPLQTEGGNSWKTDLHLKPPLTQEQTQRDEKAAMIPDIASTLTSHWQHQKLLQHTLQKAPRRAGILDQT